MKNILVLSLALFIAALSGAAQPKLSIVEGQKFDLGKVDRGLTVTKHITLKNIGTANLELGNVEVSCGCTGTVVSNKLLKPGDTTSLAITFNSKNFSGPVHKSVTVNSNSAGSPRTLIEFSATVTENLVFNPMMFHFKDAVVGRKSTTTIKVKNEGAEEFMITGFRTQFDQFVLTVPQQPIPPGATVELTGEFTPKKAVPAFSEGVFISTTSPAQPEVYLYIMGNAKEFKFE